MTSREMVATLRSQGYTITRPHAFTRLRNIEGIQIPSAEIIADFIITYCQENTDKVNRIVDISIGLEGDGKKITHLVMIDHDKEDTTSIPVDIHEEIDIYKHLSDED